MAGSVNFDFVFGAFRRAVHGAEMVSEDFSNTVCAEHSAERKKMTSLSHEKSIAMSLSLPFNRILACGRISPPPREQ